jgi:predicted PurR-regulated permease PerM
MRPRSFARRVLEAVLVVVLVVVSLYLLYLLRKPIGWVLAAGFLAVALSGPVNVLAKRMKRGFAITIVFLGVLAVPLLLGAIIVPPIVDQVDNLARDAPRYAADVREFVSENERLRSLDEDYDLTTKLEEEAATIPGRVGDAAGILSDVGFGLINSIFALVTILVLTAFILGSGQRWRDAALKAIPEERAERVRRVLDRIAHAVAGYMAGALAIALVAGLLTYLVLTVLGVDFAGPLAVFAGVMSLIPLIGATIAAVVIGVVTLFQDFPTDTIIWAVWAVIYQQLENNLVQPQIQKRTVDVQPFIVLVAVLFGSTLLGVVGAIVAIRSRRRSRSCCASTSTTAGRSASWRTPSSRRRWSRPRWAERKPPSPRGGFPWARASGVRLSGPAAEPWGVDCAGEGAASSPARSRSSMVACAGRTAATGVCGPRGSGPRSRRRMSAERR